MSTQALVKSLVFAGLTTAAVALVGCQSPSGNSATATDGSAPMTTGAMGASGTAVPSSSMGSTPASPNTNGIRNETTTGERAIGSVSSGSGSPATVQPGTVYPTTNPSGASVSPSSGGVAR